MEANPYAPPKARVADVEPTSHGLKKRSVLMMILFTIITLGIYYPVWWFRRRAGLNRLNSPDKVPLWPLLLMVMLWVVQLGLGVLEGANDGPVLNPVNEMVVTMFQLAVGISMLLLTFKVKGMIEDHATPEDASPSFSFEHLKLSGLMTFFFSIYYLQWALNRYVIAATPEHSR